MSIFWYEFFYYLSASLAILVSVSAATLFMVTFRYERQMNTVWRILGFTLLALTFLFLILERKEPSIVIITLLLQIFAFYSIFRGVLAEPKLLHLWRVPKIKETKAKETARSKKLRLQIRNKTWWAVGVTVGIIILFVLPGYLLVKDYLPSLFELAAIGFIAATIYLQVKRYKGEKATRQNMWPLVGYVFLLIRGFCMFFYRLPDLDVVFLRQLSLEYSAAWVIALISTIAAFVFLGIWAWNFVKVRPFLRTYVVFISIVLFVASLGALIFTSFIFKVIENNNLELMLKGAETESVIMTDRANTAMFIARLVSQDDDFLEDVKNNNYGSLIERTQDYLDSADADILRVYNVFGEVIASPSDPRDRGQVHLNDKLLAFSLVEGQQARTFDTQPGVLSDVIVARAIHPLILNNVIIGAVETGYKFDNAFVDFSKQETNLDVTIYTGNQISASTIQTADGVSRFVGTVENDKKINEMVMQIGLSHTTVVDRFGEPYYSAFKPIRDVDGTIIGMVSVGTPTFFLIEATRQQLVTTFILIAVLSALISLIGHYAMPKLNSYK